MRWKGLFQKLALAVVIASGGAIAGSAIVSQSPTAIAQTTSDGFTLFGGVEAQYRLGYLIDNNERRSTRARYYLEVAGRKMPREVLELEIAYPEEFEENGGYFTAASFEIRDGNGRGGGSIPIDEVILNTTSNVIEIYPEEPIPANQSFVIVIHDVRNPNRYGKHYFNLRALFNGGVDREFVGIWPLDVADNLTN